MIDEAAARRVAEDTIQRIAERPEVPPLTIIESEEVPLGWVFYYQSARYVQTRAFSDMLIGNAPVMVERSTGQPHVTGTARSVDYYLAEFGDGSHSCELCRTAAPEAPS